MIYIIAAVIRNGEEPNSLKIIKDAVIEIINI